MIIGVDTGGTKTLVARFSDDGTLEASSKFPTPPQAKDYFRALMKAIGEVNDNSSPIRAISLALPGINIDGVILWGGGNLTWKNFHIKEELATHFPHAQILTENDANLGGLSETRALSPIPLASLYVTVSTGIGTGIITKGVIDEGTRLSEGGHIMIEFDGRIREWESFASGRAIYNTYGRYARDITSKKIWNDIADRISRGFLVLIPVLQPEVVIIGGSIGTYFERYGERLNALVKERLPDHISCPKFVAAKRPEEAVIYGCYYYAADRLAA